MSLRWMTATILTATAIAMVSEGQDDPRGGKRMSFKAPVLDNEAQWSDHIPSTLNCEGCKAITYQINSILWNFHQTKYPKKKMKSESEVIAAVEKICKTDVFNNYGVKNVDGATKLSGPGLKAEDSAGMIMGGGRWPVRLAHRCGELMGEFDEYDIYEMIAKGKGKEKPLFNLYCLNERDKKLNSCGGGLDKLLETNQWMDSKGQSHTVKVKAEDDFDEDEDDYNDEL